MYYLVQKKGMKDSAAIFKTREAAEHDARMFYPTLPFRIVKITKADALKRIEKYKKRLQGRVPDSNIRKIGLPRR